MLYKVIEKVDGSLHNVLVVPRPMKKEALEKAHKNLSGHLGIYKTHKQTEAYFYWQNMHSDVKKYVRECLVCQQYKSGAGLQQLWQELPPVHAPLERVSVDLLDCVNGCHGYRYILSVLDHYSIFVRLYPLRSKNTDEVCEAMEGYVSDFGAPTSLLADNGGEFTSAAFREMCRKFHIQTGYITPYHPQGNSLTERMHRTCKGILRALCQGYPLRWPKLLQKAQTIMNQAIHSTTGQTPYFGFYSRHPPNRNIGVLLPQVPGSDEDISLAHDLLKQTHLNMARKFRAVANRNRVNQNVEVGALVWVKAETLLPGASRKLQAKWIGPYRVIESIRDGSAYRLKNVFDDSEIQRAAEKVKPYVGEEQWLDRPQELYIPEVVEPEPRPVRERRPPPRLIEEM